MTRYLYGATVQGIQDFIFETNKLVEIVGASEFVESICTDLFKNLLGPQYEEKENIISAAGNIKHLFADRAACEKAVRDFPIMVCEKAPGLTMSQAVVVVDGEISSDDFNQLERLLDIQRNKPTPAFQTAWMAVERSRRTGQPAERKEKDRDDGNIDNYLSRQEILKGDHAEGKRLAGCVTGNENVNPEVFSE